MKTQTKKIKAWATVERDAKLLSYWFYKSNFHSGYTTIAGIFRTKLKAKAFIKSWEGENNRKYPIRAVPCTITYQPPKSKKK